MRLLLIVRHLLLLRRDHCNPPPPEHKKNVFFIRGPFSFFDVCLRSWMLLIFPCLGVCVCLDRTMGVINILFPKATIIHTKRSFMDVVFRSAFSPTV